MSDGAGEGEEGGGAGGDVFQGERESAFSGERDADGGQERGEILACSQFSWPVVLIIRALQVSPESESRDGVARRHGVYPPSSGSFEACMLGGEELPRKAAISGYGYALEHHGRVVVNVAKYMSLFGV